MNPKFDAFKSQAVVASFHTPHSGMEKRKINTVMRYIVTTGFFLLLLLAVGTTLMAQTVLSVEGGNTGTWTAPLSGGPFYVRITAKGGDGGRGASDVVLDVAGGQGATLSGIFKVMAGQAIRAISGAKGSDGDQDVSAGGGGGAGAVNAGTNTILLLAGGGNGGNSNSSGSGAFAFPGNGNGGILCGLGSGGGGGVNGPGEGAAGGGQVSLSSISRGGSVGAGAGGSGMGGGGGISELSSYDRGGGGGQTGGGGCNESARSLPGGLCQNNTSGQSTLTPQDGYVKVELLSTVTYYKDGDGDGFGDPAQGQPGPVGCNPENYVSNNTDYDDTNKDVHLPTLTCPHNLTVANDAGKCGAVVTYTAPVAPQVSSATIVSDTFRYSGSIVQWTVPQGVTNLTITAKGAEGATHVDGYAAGLGASVKGDFTTVQGTVLKILVGGMPTNTDGLNASGGGGSFITDAANAPLIIAGGGGGSGGSIDAASKHGQAGEAGGNGADRYYGIGGTGGNGGQGGVIAYGGGGLLTDGALGDDTGNGKAFVNGGAGGSAEGYAGGFGGGGIGYDYFGGGSGGYSGGGGGGFLGGGGGSYNGGANPVNIGGIQNGNGLVVISYVQPLDLKVVQTSGLPPGNRYPVGATVNRFALVANNTDTIARCSSTVTVNDTEMPALTCPATQKICYSTTGRYTIPELTASDNSGIASTTYSITGATSRNGTGNNADGIFNIGVSTITWTVRDASGNQSQCATTVTINKQIITSIPDAKVLSKGVDVNTVYPGYAPAASITLTATASGATGNLSYKWSTGATTQSITVSPTTTTTYTVAVTDGSQCTGFASRQVKVENVSCSGSKVNVCHKAGNTLCIGKEGVADHLNHGDQLGRCGVTTLSSINETTSSKAVEQSSPAAGVYPSPTTGAFTLQLYNNKAEAAQVLVLDGNGTAVERRRIALIQGSQTITFNLRGKSNGIYLVQLRTEANVQTFKVYLQQ